MDDEQKLAEAGIVTLEDLEGASDQEEQEGTLARLGLDTMPADEAQQEEYEPEVQTEYVETVIDENDMSVATQFRTMMEGLSPEERAAYEAHAAEQEQIQAEEDWKKHEAMVEMYQSVEKTAKTNTKTPIGLILFILVVVGVISALVVKFVILAPPPEEVAEPEAVETAPVPIPIPERQNLDTYKVSIEGEADAVFVNGQPVSGGEAQFVKGHRNSVMAYRDGMVPYFQTFEANSGETKVELSFESDKLYLKGTLEFNLADKDTSGMVARLDGNRLENFPASVDEVVLGYPHILILERPGYRNHMQLIWPNIKNSEKKPNKVSIPMLKKEGSSYDTDASLGDLPQSSKPYTTKLETTKSDSKRNVFVNPGDIVEVHVNREQRKELNVSVIPDGFGTLVVDATLWQDSLGKVLVKFNNKVKGGDLKVCLRRVGELLCPEMNESQWVPSGTDWELIGIQGTLAAPTLVNGTVYLRLDKDKQQDFDCTIGKDHFLSAKQVVYKDAKPD